MKKTVFKWLLLIFPLLYSIEANAQRALNKNSKGIPSSLPNKLSAKMERDGDSTLGMSYSLTKCGLNYTQSSAYVTNRYTDDPGSGLPATLSISNLPACFNIEKAYLYWITSSSSIDPAFTINGTPQTGIVIGNEADKCWSTLQTHSYRADVTSFVTGNGSFLVDINEGAFVTDGVTLFVVYSDPTAGYEGTIMLHDGCIVNRNGGTSEYNMTGISTCGSNTNSAAFMLTSDYQNNVVNPIHFISAGNDIDTFSNDFYNFDIVYPDVDINMDSMLFSTGSIESGDCFAILMTGLYFQSQSCLACTGSTSPINVTLSSTSDTCGICNGTASIIASGGSSGYIYNWYPGFPIGQGTDFVSGLCFGNYSVTVSDSSCNSTYTSFNIDTIGFMPSVSIDPISPICSFDTIVTLTASPPGGIWSGTGIVNSSTGEYDASINSQGEFEVYYSYTQFSCTNQDTLTVLVTDPSASFDFTINLDTVFYSNLSSNALHFYWDFGDGDVSSLYNPTHIYSSNGFYTVCLSVEGDYGCTEVFCDTIQIVSLTVKESELIEFNIYPNPSNGKVYYSSMSGVENITIADLTGKIIWHENYQPTISGEIDLSGFSQGLYFLNVEMNGVRKTIKFELIK